MSHRKLETFMDEDQDVNDNENERQTKTEQNLLILH